MRIAFGWIYGLLAIASLFWVVGAYHMRRDRLREINRPRPDLYLMLVEYFGLHGVGGVMFWTLRAWDGQVNGLINFGSTWWATGITLGLYLYSKGGVVRVSSLNGKPYVWRNFLIACTLWTVIIWGWLIIAP